MNENYLWDGSGEPDPEIQNLEETLGRWRCARRESPPLPQRSDISEIVPKRSYARYWMAAAAVVALLAVAAIGLRTLRDNNAPQHVVATPSHATQKIDPPLETRVVMPADQSAPRAWKVPPRNRKRLAARTELARAERKRGTLAKDRLMLALRIASSELRDLHRTVYAENVSSER